MWIIWDFIIQLVGSGVGNVGLSSMQQGIGILLFILLLAPVLNWLYPTPRPRVIVKRVVSEPVYTYPSYGTYNPVIGYGKDV